ncbi:MAG TPA: hypothetical protein VHA07_12725 [Devosia sp.]|nr:hypothetical protein [Devosia sp.]
MAVARTQTFDQRIAILGRLSARNRVVSVLRLAVPAAGVAAFLLLAVQLWLGNIAQQYGVSGIRIDRGNLVVETPQYSEMGTDGTRYLVVARDARTPLLSPGVIEMTEPRLSMMRPGRSPLHATGASATVSTDEHAASVPGVVAVTSDDGLFGTLHDVHADMRRQLTTAKGPIDLTFPDGSHLTADAMQVDGSTQLWTFSNATLVVPDLPHAQVSWMNVFAVFSESDP